MMTRTVVGLSGTRVGSRVFPPIWNRGGHSARKEEPSNLWWSGRIARGAPDIDQYTPAAGALPGCLLRYRVGCSHLADSSHSIFVSPSWSHCIQYTPCQRRDGLELKSRCTPSERLPSPFLSSGAHPTLCPSTVLLCPLVLKWAPSPSKLS